MLDVAEGAGLDPVAAGAALDDETLAAAVRAEEREARELGITAVPTMIVNGRYLIPGAQEPETYAKLLRKAAERG